MDTSESMAASLLIFVIANIRLRDSSKFIRDSSYLNGSLISILIIVIHQSQYFLSRIIPIILIAVRFASYVFDQPEF